ncbi:S46 family peptidase [Corallococcus sp. EGB]|uniref:S46 family peptidase n=1 Tax=Corallococcus sp. EGB TaxID=1521117 RepID=UPI001CC06C14|nr:S46 family peptidase [Corallococcus sp. EGB]
MGRPCCSLSALLKAQDGSAWDEVARAQEGLRRTHDAYRMPEGDSGPAQSKRPRMLRRIRWYSGSPMFNQDAELTGVVFDSNIHSLGGEYGFDARRNRTIGVDSTALLEALDKVYGASRPLEEVRAARGKWAPMQ